MSSTGLGKPVIPIGLVGHQAVLNRDGIYDDAYLAEINQMYSLDEILGERKTGIAQGINRDLAHFTFNSPLQNAEGGDVLDLVLIASAKSEMWQPHMVTAAELRQAGYNYRTVEKALEIIGRPPVKTGALDEGFIYGMQKARAGGLVLPSHFQEQLIVLPSQAFVEYCAQKR